MKTTPFIVKHAWLFVVLAFALLLGAWSALITIAVKHAPETIEVGSGDH
ncbi:hypothetical protein HAHE_39620 [Haloferula helveola]|uniref:Uncharacterized protein n=1 Tax=Haloferula helveola TaxID=490095 RepID=A0ABM7RJ33_9BACT|nr:hypothetical protein HAHE_39620 [Haloferula helveola]